jgi:hypothetical protein
VPVARGPGGAAAAARAFALPDRAAPAAAAEDLGRLERAARLGHRMAAPAPPLAAPPHREAAPPAAAVPVQRALGPAENLFGDTEEETTMRGHVDRFNQTLGEAGTDREGTHQKLAHLDDVEHSLYRWFDAHVHEEDHPKRGRMFDLMDQVQNEHRRLIRHTVDNHLPLWVAGAQTEEASQRTQDTWNAITQAGEGGAVRFSRQIPNYGGDLPADVREQLETDTFSDVARLMSRPHGRGMVSGLVAGATEQKPLMFGLRPLQDLTEGKISPSASDEGDPRAAIRVRDNDGAQELVPGEGGAVRLKLVPGLADSDYSDFDAGGRRIPSPTFIGLGHELVHGMHYQRGTFPKQHGPPDTAPTFPQLNEHYQGDLEEFATIASAAERDEHAARTAPGRFAQYDDPRRSAPGVLTMERFAELNAGIPNEAELRAEHGLGIRKGHTTTVTPERHEVPVEQRGGQMTAEQTAELITRPGVIGQRLMDLVEPPEPPAEELEHAEEAPAAARQAGRCFLTTACVAARGLADDCEELTVLRRFRDGWLLAQPGGGELVALYERVAPAIVRGIARRSDAAAVLDGLYAVIRRCVEAIGAGRPEEARDVYSQMIVRLFADYGGDEAEDEAGAAAAASASPPGL